MSRFLDDSIHFFITGGYSTERDYESLLRAIVMTNISTER